MGNRNKKNIDEGIIDVYMYIEIGSDERNYHLTDNRIIRKKLKRRTGVKGKNTFEINGIDKI